MRRVAFITTLIAALPLPALAQTAPATPPAFAPCAACHSTRAGENRLGPSLSGIVGRRVASVRNFTYSDAMKAKGGTWTAAALDTYLTNPRTDLPGTRMSYPGQRDAAKRAALIAYLRTLR